MVFEKLYPSSDYIPLYCIKDNHIELLHKVMCLDYYETPVPHYDGVQFKRNMRSHTMSDFKEMVEMSKDGSNYFRTPKQWVYLNKYSFSLEEFRQFYCFAVLRKEDYLNPEIDNNLMSNWYYIALDDPTNKYINMYLRGMGVHKSRVIRKNWADMFREFTGYTPTMSDYDIERQRTLSSMFCSMYRSEELVGESSEQPIEQTVEQTVEEHINATLDAGAILNTLDELVGELTQDELDDPFNFL